MSRNVSSSGWATMSSRKPRSWVEDMAGSRSEAEGGAEPLAQGRRRRLGEGGTGQVEPPQPVEVGRAGQPPNDSLVDAFGLQVQLAEPGGARRARQDGHPGRSEAVVRQVEPDRHHVGL